MSKYVSNISNTKLKQIILVAIITIVLGSSSIVSSGFLTPKSSVSSDYKITATILNPVETIGSQQVSNSYFINNSFQTIVEKAKTGKTESHLLVIKAPNGMGSTYPAPGSFTYTDGLVTKIYASPEPGWSLDGWILDDSPAGRDNPVSVKMNKDHIISAVFSRNSYSLSLGVTGSGATNPSGTQTYPVGSEAWVTATPDSGWLFDHWVLDGAPAYGGSPVTVSMSSDHALVAVFVEKQYLLKVLSSGDGGGSVVLDPPGGIYSFGTVITLTASTAEGSSFTGWSGSLTGSANPATIMMDGDKTVTAAFNLVPYTPVVAPIGSGGGSVAPSPPVTPSPPVAPSLYSVTVSVSGQGSVSRSPSQASYASGSTVQLTATPASGYTFTGWSGGLSGSANPATLTVDGNKAVTATFTQATQTQHTLTMQTPIGSGTTNPSVGAHIYQAGVRVDLTAYPASGWVFDHWRLDGVDASSSNPGYVTMGADRTLQAVFAQAAQAQYTLAVTKAGTGSGSIALSPAGGSYASGTVVTLTATPTTGSSFTGWGGSITGSANPATVTMNGNKAVTATFTQATQTQYTLTIQSPVGSGTTSPATGVYTYSTLTPVQVTAYPAAGYVFSRWVKDGGASTMTNNPTSINAGESNRDIQAVFTQATQAQYTLTVTKVGTGSGSVSLSPAGGSYASGTVVTLTASPTTGSGFTGWSGALSGSANPATITMDSAKSVTATFTQNQFTVTVTTSGQGSVAKSPSQASYVYGSSVQLTATPAFGYTFTGWSGGLSGSANPATLMVDGNKAVTATFTPIKATAYTFWVQGNVNYVRNEATGTVTSTTDLDTLLMGVIHTLSSAGGGVIHFNAGTYNSPYAGGGCLLYLAPNITLEGAGQTSTIMNNIDFAIGVPNVIIRDMGFTGPYHSTYLINIYAPATNITLERLNAVGIRDAWSVFCINPADGAVIDGVKFIDLTLTDSDGYPFSINGGTMNGGLARNIEWTRCKVYQAGLKSTRKCDWIVGFDITELAKIENVHVKDCLAEYCWESGFHVEYEPLKTNVVIENCVSNYNGQKPLPPGGWMWGYGFLVSTGVTLINPQGTGNYGGLVFNNGGGAVVI